MKRSQINVRTTYAQKQKLKNMAEDKGVTLSKEVNDIIQKVSIQLAQDTPQQGTINTIYDTLSRAARVLGRIELKKSVGFAPEHITDLKDVLEMSKGILEIAEQMNAKNLTSKERIMQNLRKNK